MKKSSLRGPSLAAAAANARDPWGGIDALSRRQGDGANGTARFVYQAISTTLLYCGRYAGGENLT